MPSSHLSHEAFKSLSRLRRPSTAGNRRALFPVPSHVRAQQRRTFQWQSPRASQQAVQSHNQIHYEDHFAAPREGAHGAVTVSWNGAEDAIKPAAKRTVKEEGEGEKELLPTEDIFSAEPFDTLQEARVAMDDALLLQLPSRVVLSTFLRAARHPEYLNSLDFATLKSIMDVIRPHNLLSPFRRIHRTLHPAILRYHQHRSLTALFKAYTESVTLLLDHCEQSASYPNDWRLKFMMEVARVTGDGNMARRIFQLMRKRPDRRISLASYNDLLAALCWDGIYTAESRRLRVTPMSLKKRRSGSSTTHGYRVGEGGIKEEVQEIVKHMQEQGVDGNATTWGTVLVALAREGDLHGVKFLLKKVWDVDVDAIQRNDESGLLFENQIPETSSFWPDADTLYNVAHAFCINNDYGTALQIVDHLSRKYDLKITSRVWAELMEWAYVFSVPRYGARNAEQVKDQRLGQLPPDAVQNLWSLMSSPDYGVKLTASMAYFIFKSAIRRSDLETAINIMTETEGISKKSSFRYGISVKDQENYDQTDSLTVELQRLKHWRDRSIIKNFLRSLLASQVSKSELRTPNSEKDRDWFHRAVPDILHRFAYYGHTTGNAYSMRGGRVHFHFNPDGAWVLMDKLKSPFHDSVLLQPPPIEVREPWLGLTRQQRLQLRHANHPSSKPRTPLYQPMWFEADDVRDHGFDSRSGQAEKADDDQRRGSIGPF